MLLKKIVKTKKIFEKKLGKKIPIPYRIKNFAEYRSVPDFIEIGSHKMHLLKNSVVSKYLTEEGIWEKNETNFLRSELKNGEVVLDIGANIGYFSLIFAELVGKDGKVFAFEPETKNFEILTKNIHVNGYDNVITEKIVLGEKIGKTKLYLSNIDTGSHRLYLSNDASKKFEVVDQTTLDEYFKNNPIRDKISFLKIDVEGSEMGVLRGMDYILRNNNKLRLMLEFSPHQIKDFGSEPAALVELLSEYGFSFYLINNGLKKIDEKFLLEQPNDALLNIFLRKD